MNKPFLVANRFLIPYVSRGMLSAASSRHSVLESSPRGSVGAGAQLTYSVCDNLHGRVDIRQVCCPLRHVPALVKLASSCNRRFCRIYSDLVLRGFSL